MSRALIAGVIIAAAILTALWSWRTHEAGAATDVAGPTGAAPSIPKLPSKPQSPDGHAAQSAQPPPPQSSALTFEQRFRDADDLLAFVESIHDAAEAGDGASAWWIYRAIQRCDREYQMHFRRRGGIRTLDEALQINAGNPAVPEEETRKLYAQCGRMRNSEYLSKQAARDWLSVASSAGLPVAHLESARVLVYEATQKGRPLDGESREAATLLTAYALRSKDPAVVMAMAELSYAWGSSGPFSGALDWMLAACQRGFDCSPKSEVVEILCRGDPACQPYEDLQDVLRRNFSEEYDGFERRARQINQLLDENRFSELGISVPEIG